MAWMRRIVVFMVLAVFVLGVTSAFAWQVNLAWDDPNNNPATIAGYYLYFKRPALGETSYSSVNRIDVGYNLMFLVTNMQYGLEYCFVATAHTVDTPSVESGYSNEVCDKPKPVATITNPVNGTTVSGIQLVQVAVTDPDDVDGAQSVTFEINTTGTWIPMPWNATSQRYEASWNTTGYIGQSVALTAIAVDPSGFSSDAVSTTVTVDNRLHVGDLDRSATSGSPYWRATVRIQVHDSLHTPVPNASVSGSWSSASSGATACITDGTGWCSVSAQIQKKKASTTFTVRSVQPGSYQSIANHDPDGDSNGTSITVNRP